MAAAQVAKKLKDKRKQRTIEGIFKKVLSIMILQNTFPFNKGIFRECSFRVNRKKTFFFNLIDFARSKR